MRGEDPRNGRLHGLPPFGQTAASRAIPDVIRLLHRRTRGVLAAAAAEGLLPADLDLRRFAVAPPRPGMPGDAVVDAGLIYARDAGAGAGRLGSRLAAGLHAAPEIEAVAVVGGLLVVTLWPSVLLAAVDATLRARSWSPLSPNPAGRPVPAADSLAEARAAVEADIRGAIAAAGRTAAGAVRDDGGMGGDGPAPRAPVFVRGRASSDGDALTWIGADAFRFAVAACRPGAALHLDLDVLGDRSRADPSFWARYAHARACGALRRAAASVPGIERRLDHLAAPDLSGLVDVGEVLLARLIAHHPSVVAGGSPRKLAIHLHHLAGAVHSEWNRSKQQPQSRFVNEELRDLAIARLGLVTAAAFVLRSGLDMLGISAPGEMS